MDRKTSQMARAMVESVGNSLPFGSDLGETGCVALLLL